jgi:diaminopimelate decarboxylase
VTTPATTFRYIDRNLHAEDVALAKLADAYGTPLYVYSAAQIRRNFHAYDDAFGRVLGRGAYTICYACKANSNQAVLELLQTEGAGADIVSAGEMRRALAAGVAPEKIIFSGVGKTAADIDAALAAGVVHINIEAEGELEMISAIARKRRVTAQVAVRVNPNVDARTHAKITTGRKENKFGIDIDAVPALFRRARRQPFIEMNGVAVHIGSQLTTLAPFKRAYQRLARLVAALRRQGETITRVDLGGGIGISYRGETPPDLHLYALMVRDVFDGMDVHLCLEPGRSIVGNAGVLLSRVVQLKSGTAKHFAIIDAGMNDLLRPALYDAYHGLMPVTKKTGRARTYDIVGPVCESSDVFLTNEKMPVLETGDLVVLRDAGAYGAVMSSAYNARPPAGEVLVSGKKHARIRRQQTVDDLIAQDIVPAWL